MGDYMNTITAKFVLPAVLAIAFYGLGVSVGYAIETDCTYTKDKGTAFCSTNDNGAQNVWRCDKHSDGNWSCVKILRREPSKSLHHALNKAIAAQKR